MLLQVCTWPLGYDNMLTVLDRNAARTVYVPIGGPGPKS